MPRSMRGMVRTLLGLLMAITAATGAPAQDIDVRPGMQVGDVWRYSAALDVLVAQESDAHSEMGRIVQTAHLELEAIREADDGGLVVRGRFNRITSVWRRADEQLEFTWMRAGADDAQEAAPAPPAERELSKAEAFDAAYQMLADRPFELTVSADGVIVDISGLSEPLTMLSRSPDLDESALGMFLPPRFAEHIQALWNADGARAAGEVGDEWTESRRVRLGPAGALDFTTRWTAAEVKNGVLTGRGVITATVIPPSGTATAQPELEILRSAGDATLTWSLADQRLTHRVEKLDLATRWTLGDLEITIAQLSTRKLDRLD